MSPRMRYYKGDIVRVLNLNSHQLYKLSGPLGSVKDEFLEGSHYILSDGHTEDCFWTKKPIYKISLEPYSDQVRFPYHIRFIDEQLCLEQRPLRNHIRALMDYIKVNQ